MKGRDDLQKEVLHRGVEDRLVRPRAGDPRAAGAAGTLKGDGDQIPIDLDIDVIHRVSRRG